MDGGAVIISFRFSSLPVNAPLRITSKFGPRNTGIKGASTFHKGVDLGRDWGNEETEVLAVKDGVVSSNYWNAYRGWVVTIRHDSTYSTLYQHLKTKSPLPIGAIVRAGQTLGIMGNSSDKSVLMVAVHLHFELRKNGVPVDPLPYLRNVKEVDDMDEKRVREIIREELSGKDAPVSDWAEGFWKRAKDEGLVDGSSPAGVVTREQAATMLCKMLDKV